MSTLAPQREAAGTGDLHDNGVAGKLISLQFGTRPIEW